MRPKHTGPGSAGTREAPRPSGSGLGRLLPSWAPPPAWATPPPAPPSLGQRGGGCREARAVPDSSPSLPSRATRFSSFSVNNSWAAGGGGRWPRRSLGGRLPLTREPPCEPEDGGGSRGRPGGGGAEARGAEHGGGGGRERQQPVAAQQNRNQRQPDRHLSRPSRRSERAAPAGARTSFPPASPRLPRPPSPREGERAGRRPPLGARGRGPGRAGFPVGRPRCLGPALSLPRSLPPSRRSGRCARARPGAGRTWAPSRAARPPPTAAPARTRAPTYLPAAAEALMGPPAAEGRGPRPPGGSRLRCRARTSPAPRAAPRRPRRPRAAALSAGPGAPWRRGPAPRSPPSASPTAAAASTARRTRCTAARRTAAAAAAAGTGTGRRAGARAGRAWSSARYQLTSRRTCLEVRPPPSLPGSLAPTAARGPRLRLFSPSPFLLQPERCRPRQPPGRKVAPEPPGRRSARPCSVCFSHV